MLEYFGSCLLLVLADSPQASFSLFMKVSRFQCHKSEAAAAQLQVLLRLLRKCTSWIRIFAFLSKTKNGETYWWEFYPFLSVRFYGLDFSSALMNNHMLGHSFKLSPSWIQIFWLSRPTVSRGRSVTWLPHCMEQNSFSDAQKRPLNGSVVSKPQGSLLVL